MGAWARRQTGGHNDCPADGCSEEERKCRSGSDDSPRDHYLDFVTGQVAHHSPTIRLWCPLVMRSDHYLHKMVISAPTGNIQGAVLGLVLCCAVCDWARLIWGGGNGAGEVDDPYWG